MSIREVAEGLQIQGVDERIAYTLDVSNVGSSPTTISAVVKDPDGDDVTAALMPTNTPTASGDVITLSPLRDGTVFTRYRVEVKYTVSGNVVETYFHVYFET
jgi:hypothetical protein